MVEPGQKALPIVLEEGQEPGPGLVLTRPPEKAEEALKEGMKETTHQKGWSQLTKGGIVGVGGRQVSVTAAAAVQPTLMMERVSPWQTGLGGQGPAVLSEG